MKYYFFFIFAFLIFFFKPHSSGAQGLPSNEALPLSVEWDETLTVDKSTKTLTEDHLTTALTLVRAFPPSGQNNLFSWNGSRETLKNKQIRFFLTVSSSPTLKKILALSNIRDLDGDAFTTTIFENQDVKIIVVLLLDKLIFDSVTPGIGLVKERPDGAIRTIVALAHEIYGNVQVDLESSPKGKKNSLPVSRKQREIQAFHASLDFIDRVLASKSYSRFSVQVQAEFVQAKAREQYLLQTWQ